MGDYMSYYQEYLDLFWEYLVTQGIKEDTVRKQYTNIHFYLRDFCEIYYECDINETIHLLDEFFRDWFPRKAMWSTPNAVKENITSMNKFYKCLFENTIITKDVLNNYKSLVKENKIEWMACSDFSSDTHMIYDVSSIEEPLEEIVYDIMQINPWDHVNPVHVHSVVLNNERYFINYAFLRDLRVIRVCKGYLAFKDLLNLMLFTGSYQAVNYQYHLGVFITEDNQIIPYKLNGLDSTNPSIEEKDIMAEVLDHCLTIFENDLDPTTMYQEENGIITELETDDLLKPSIIEKSKYKADEMTLRRLRKKLLPEVDMGVYFDENDTYLVILDTHNKTVVHLSQIENNEKAIFEILVEVFQDLGGPSQVNIKDTTINKPLLSILINFSEEISIDTAKVLDNYLVDLYSQRDNERFVDKTLKELDFIDKYQSKHLKCLEAYRFDSIKRIAGRFHMKTKKVYKATLINQIMDSINIDLLSTLIDDQESLELFKKLSNRQTVLVKKEALIAYESLLKFGIAFSVKANHQYAVWLPDEMKELFIENLPLLENRNKIKGICQDFAQACAELYGVITINQAIKIFEQIMIDMPEEDIAEAIDIIRYLDMGYNFYVDHDMIIHEAIREDEELLEVLMGLDKPYYVPNKSEFLRYADEEYIEETSELKSFVTFLKHELNLSEERSYDLIFELKDMIDFNIQDRALVVLEMFDVHLTSEKQFTKYMELYMKYHNASRSWLNRGHTPKELSPQRKHIKVGRNEPCPCGSGKKYKKCCGK